MFSHGVLHASWFCFNSYWDYRWRCLYTNQTSAGISDENPGIYAAYSKSLHIHIQIWRVQEYCEIVYAMLKQKVEQTSYDFYRCVDCIFVCKKCTRLWNIFMWFLILNPTVDSKVQMWYGTLIVIKSNVLKFSYLIVRIKVNAFFFS